MSADLDVACGPASASAEGIWGPWSHDVATATRAAIAQARAMAESLCGGTCTAPQSCKYKESSASADGLEERTVDGRTEYRVKASSKGSCGCA